MSPPPEEGQREISTKAAKVMGVGRSKSTREKGTRRIPDPYPIDSDDMIAVDGPEDSAKDIEEPTERKKSSRSKRQSTYMSGALSPEDEVMVDAPPRAVPGADDFDFVSRPSPVRRTTSSAKKPGLMGGILGAFSSRPAPDRRTSKVYESEDGGRRKRGSVYDDDYSKRLRRDDRKIGRAKHSDGEGLTDAAPVTDVEDQEAREARRRERRERRDREAADEEAKASRRREKDDAQRVRAREADDERRREEKRARRAERETRRAEEDRLAREQDQAREERRERRREREKQQQAEEEAAAARSKTTRRRSTYVDAAGDDEARRIRREERKLRRGMDPSGGDKEPSRRRSDHPAPAAADDYFGARNGERSPRKNPTTPLTHAIKTGGDKTASWVHSLEPDPPPIERTIIDAPVHYGEDGVPDRHPLEGDDTTAREFRHRRRREQEAHGRADDGDRRRRRPRDGENVRSSDGSSGQRAPVNSIGYNDMGERTFDGRPAFARGESKRGSWFKKIAGL